MSALQDAAELSPRIILIEDDGALRAALSFELRAAGYVVSGAPRSEILLDADFPAEAVCLLFDQQLPGISGIDALEQLRARGIRAPAFLMTTAPSRRLRARASAADVHVLEKPILGDRLVAAIRALHQD